MLNGKAAIALRYALAPACIGLAILLQISPLGLLFHPMGMWTAHLKASEETYARAMEASKDGIWQWNPTTDEIFMSDRARRLWGVPEPGPYI